MNNQKRNVVVEELIPEMSEGEHSNIGVVMFAVGFSLMMVYLCQRLKQLGWDYPVPVSWLERNEDK